MAKGKSKKPGKTRNIETVVSVGTPKKASVPRGVRKHLRLLERQLSDAARQEHKRLRKLERATFRRQMLQAALEELRGETTVVVVQPTADAPVIAVATTPTAKPRQAAKPRAAVSPAAPAKASAPGKPTTAAARKTTTSGTTTPTAKPRQAATRTRTTRAATAAKAPPKATPAAPKTTPAAPKATD
jgi:hypothetical protein